MIVLISVFPPYRGGISTFSEYMFKNLNEHDSIKAFNYSHLYPPFLFPGKTQYLKKNDRKEIGDRVIHSYNPLSWKKNAEHIIAQLDPSDHIIICYWHPFFAPVLTHLIKRIKTWNNDQQISILAHNVLPHESFPAASKLAKRFFNSADQLIVLSEQSLIETRSLNLNIPVKKLFHPVYEMPFPAKSKDQLRIKHSFEEDDNVLLFFGLVRPYKGLDVFIEALNSLDLEDGKIKPLIVGEFYTDKESILKLIDPEDRKHYTVIDRFVSDDEMAEYLTLSDALIMPYRSASQSGILANAINFHLPSVVTDLPGLTEHITNKENGIIVKADDADSLKTGLLSILEPEIRSNISRGLIRLKDKLSWQNFTLDVCKELKTK